MTLGFARDIGNVAWAQDVLFAITVQREATAEDQRHLDPGIQFREKGIALIAGKELRHAGAQAAFRNENAKAFGVVIRLGGTHGKADAILSALDAEDRGITTVEEVGKVFAEDQGEAGEVSKGRNDPACLKLGKEAGGQPSLFAQLDQPHGTFEAKTFDALAEPSFGEELLGGFGVDGRAKAVLVRTAEVVGALIGLKCRHRERF